MNRNQPPEEEFWTLLSLCLSNEASLEENERLMYYLELDEKYQRSFEKASDLWNQKPSPRSAKNQEFNSAKGFR